jgi:hypothetical protein
MQMYRLMWEAVLMVAVMAWMSWGTEHVWAQRARVPQTGQIESYAAGDDGDIQAGVAWPTPRFRVNSDGTVRDNLTGFIWLQEANCLQGTWAEALTLANTLASGQCGLTDRSVAGDWRLPNIRELQSLSSYAVWPPLSNTAGDGPYTTGDPFIYVQGIYWSSTTAAFSPLYAWIVNIGETGGLFALDKSYVMWVWPMRGGD